MIKRKRQIEVKGGVRYEGNLQNFKGNPNITARNSEILLWKTTKEKS